MIWRSRVCAKGRWITSTKPLDINHLSNSVWRATERRKLEQDNLRYQQELEEKNRRLEEAEKMLLKHAVVLEQRVEQGNQALLRNRVALSRTVQSGQRCHLHH